MLAVAEMLANLRKIKNIFWITIICFELMVARQQYFYSTTTQKKRPHYKGVFGVLLQL
jgi:hypothetical protein